ncbi:methylated-DNA--protein-cysteine methyltransferase isoform X1 [Xiphophorus maculatus]|uniref:methylated-DNA--protein-cysteine methyltransferase isoform X1 n=2 Tax=Xiphophorus maculatus TaxID=8083 RepID=UPI000C6DC4E9|nr:methylated-DNA--protein-cysteine methyltransferase isoform X1 [Xiphophorus maculatus]XP_027862374.1 methylated-DNA--protein-cysteine methyltransferase isoform X1 [Xiphophorus couchianus]
MKKASVGSEMKKQRESQCTQKTISLLSPLGTIQVSGCENGVHTIQILMDVAPAERSSAAPLSCVVTDSPAETSPEMQRCVEWLQAYFTEPQTAGSLPLPAFHHPALQGDAFTSRVLQVLLRDVKFGETVSYKRLAEMAGNPRAVRAVGGAMRRNPSVTLLPARLCQVPLLIPCHRVISSSGQSGPYMSGRGDHLKQWLLTHERQRGEG